MKIYVASSWKNDDQQKVVQYLRLKEHEVYDFKNPDKNDHGFSWSQIDKNWKEWSVDQYINKLNYYIPSSGFEKNFNAMKWADVCILVLPCGRSAHTEAGWMAGKGKKVFVYIPEYDTPELMYKIYDGISDDMRIINDWIGK